jgi:class 3 adenylate cyclase
MHPVKPSVPADSLDQQVNARLRDSWQGMFFTELFQGVSQLAMLLLLLEAIWDGGAMFAKPDIYVLLLMTLAQSAWLAQRQFSGQANPAWTRLVGLVLYALIETLIEGPAFFTKPKHLTFVILTLFFVLGRSLEMRPGKLGQSLLGTVISRTAQGLSPLFFYIALDLRNQVWLEGFWNFFNDAPHTFLLALSVTQVGALIVLTLIARRQRSLIDALLEQLKTLSRWGFGASVVEKVIRDSHAQAASRVDRAIGFIDVRGFTAWSETHTPEQVIDMLNDFYAATLEACGPELIKSKMSGDEVLLVLPANAQALQTLQNALQAAVLAVTPMQLTAGAGLWIGPVVEGFFGTQSNRIHDVIGDTVNTAKRLCDHAKGQQLLAGPVHRLTDVAASQTSIQAKGKLQPITAACFGVELSPPGKS